MLTQRVRNGKDSHLINMKSKAHQRSEGILSSGPLSTSAEPSGRFRSARLSNVLYTWVPVLLILAMVLIWFQNLDSQFPGDFFVPPNPAQYLSRFSQSWDPNQDFGLFSLFTLFPTPRILLVVFFSGIGFLPGSPVTVEFFLVLMTLLLAYFGMRYLWAAIGQTRNPSLGQVVASLYFVVNPFIMLYIENPVEIIAYAIIPWCLGFTLRGLREEETFKYSVLAGTAFTISLITFPQVGLSIITATLMIGIFALHFLRRPDSRLKQLLFMTSSLLVIVGLNAYWLALALSKADVVISLSNRVQAISPSLNTENSIFATSRLLGDWSFLAGYAGRLYVPYSVGYFSDPFTILATSAIPVFAFSAIILGPSKKRKLSIAGASLVGIVLATGINPPLGLLYSLIVSIPGFSLFRNPPRYFLAVVALGYAILLGCFVNFFSSKSKGGKLTLRRISSLGVILLVLLMIALASEPMISGEITRNWYVPSMKGYQIPEYYFQASRWLSSNDPTSRIFVLPNSGTYMATFWGYQGANIYPYIFSNPIITGSGGQYSFSSASDMIEAAYGEFYSNRTTSLGKVLSLFGASYVIFDQSVDTQFYDLPSAPLTLSVLGHQTDLVQVGVFGDLRLFKNMEDVSTIQGSYKITILNGTLTNPASIVNTDDFQNGWQLGPSFSNGPVSINGSLTFQSNHLVATLPASGQYIFAELSKNISIPTGTKYLIVDAQTSSPTSIALTLNTVDGEVPLYAENPPAHNLLNHYELDIQNYLVYRIDGVKSNVTLLRFAISNRLDTSYSGPLTVSFSRLILANQVGDLSDLIDFVQLSSFETPLDAVTLSRFVGQSGASALREVSTSTSKSPSLIVTTMDPTNVIIDARADYPFVLTYFTSFDPGFTARVDGGSPTYHFQIDGLANGWLIEQTGEFTIHISFAPQGSYLAGVGVTAASMGFIAGLSLLTTPLFSSLPSVLSKRWRKSQGG